MIISYEKGLTIAEYNNVLLANAMKHEQNTDAGSNKGAFRVNDAIAQAGCYIYITHDETGLGNITDAGGGEINIYSPAHGQDNGTLIALYGNVYNAFYSVGITTIDANNFTIEATYTVDENNVRWVTGEGVYLVMPGNTGLVAVDQNMDSLAEIQAREFTIHSGKIRSSEEENQHLKFDLDGNYLVSKYDVKFFIDAENGYTDKKFEFRKNSSADGVLLFSGDEAGSWKIHGQGENQGGSIGLSQKTGIANDITGASIIITIGVPSGVKLLGTLIRINKDISGDGGATSWNAAYSGGATQAIVTGQAFIQHTKAKALFNVNAATDITTDITNITITPNAGTFSGGDIEAIVFYQELENMNDDI